MCGGFSGVSRLLTVVLAITVASSAVSGCLGGMDSASSSDSQIVEAPQWMVGQWWMYVFSTPEYGDTTTTLIVTETDAEEGTAYMLGISSQDEARKHAVLNFNPFLGRITHDNLSVFESGDARQVFVFPLEKGNEWNFSLFGHDTWQAEVLDVSSGIAMVSAFSQSGGTITYAFNAAFGFLSNFIWEDADGTIRMQMTSASKQGENFEGDDDWDAVFSSAANN